MTETPTTVATCPNCSTPLPPHAHYCPHCGQENHSSKQPFGHLLYEFIESITHFDHKLWNTLKAIVLKPGQFVVDFVNDRRARYVPPARLYVFVSVIFFVLVNKVVDSGLEPSTLAQQKVRDVYGSDAGEFTLKGVLGEAVTERSGLGAVDAQRFYFDKQKDPLAQQAIAQLKRLSAPQLDSLTRFFNADNTGKQPTEKTSSAQNGAMLRRGITVLGPQLPARYHNRRPDVVYVALDDVVDDDTLDALGLRFVPNIYLPFDRRDTAGVTTLAALRQATDDQLLDVYRQSHVLLPRFRDSVLAEMRNVVKRLPDRHRIGNNVRVGVDNAKSGVTVTAVMSDVLLTFPNDSVQRVETRLARYLTDDELIRWLERRSGKSLANLTGYKRWLLIRGMRQSGKFEDGDYRQADTAQRLVHGIVKYTSYVMFLLMPIVAFVLLIIYFRRRKFYYEHLIFSVHVHTVFFMVLTLGLLLDYLFNWDAALGWAFGLGYLYLLLALKRAYGQGWAKTIVKFALFTMLYGIIFGSFLTVTSILGFLNV